MTWNQGGQNTYRNATNFGFLDYKVSWRLVEGSLGEDRVAVPCPPKLDGVCVIGNRVGMELEIRRGSEWIAEGVVVLQCFNNITSLMFCW